MAIFGFHKNVEDGAARLKVDANAARDRGDWADAAEKYADYLSKQPEDAQLWVQLGHARKEAGDPDGAEKAYLRALSLAPGVADTHIMLGHLKKTAGKLAQAATHYAEAVDLQPENLDARLQLAFAEKDLERFDAALVQFRVAHEMNPANQEVADIIHSLVGKTHDTSPADGVSPSSGSEDLHGAIRAMALELQSLRRKVDDVDQALQEMRSRLDALQDGVKADHTRMADRLLQIESQSPEIGERFQVLLKHFTDLEVRKSPVDTV